MLTYEQRGYDRDITQGVEQGILQGARRTLLKQLCARFGELPHTVTGAVEAIASADALNDLSERILTAPTLEAMNLPK